MILTIDVGNTRVKAAVFEGDTALEYFVCQEDEVLNLVQSILKIYPKCTDLIAASVGNIEESTFLSCQKWIKVHFLTQQDAYPFVNKYASPQTLGIDRMVLAAGAVMQFPNQNRLVIDAGTCITYDFIDENDNYLGGAISPGLRLRYESLHQYTAKLPLLNFEPITHLIGDSTVSSIHSGVVNGFLNEIDGFINDYQSKYANFIIILTGGDTVFLANRLKNTIFANSNFLLESLNQIFQYKIDND